MISLILHIAFVVQQYSLHSTFAKSGYFSPNRVLREKTEC